MNRDTHNAQQQKPISAGKYVPWDGLPRLSRTSYRRLHGRRIVLFSYLARRFEKSRARAKAISQLREQPTHVSLHGVKIAIDRERFSDKIIRHLYEGSYEKDESLSLIRTLRDDDRVLELGTGIGFMSALAARHIGSDNVMTVEANVQLDPIIQTTYRLNAVAPRHVYGLMSLARDAPPRTFYTHTKHLWSSSLEKPDRDYVTTEVESLSWQDTLADFQPTYVVMDIEGGEIELLSNFDSPHVRRMLIEVHPRKTGHEPIDRVFDHLTTIGFRIARVPRGGNVFYFER